jgi:predicted regulator of Ras-like GTPase activity (Roadblock/LC7/MglB family)
VADDVRLWSEQLASDPSSLVFLPLAETLRKRGQLDLARKVATRGLERHPHNADAHDQLARIYADSGEMQSAYDEWDTVLRLSPGHVGAIKGMAFVRFQQGNLEEAERLLIQAQEHANDADIDNAITAVRRSGKTARMSLSMSQEVSVDPRLLFADLLANDLAAILVDADGLVIAGAYYDQNGADLAADVGATLTGVSGEALRATKHLEIGEWRAIVFETDSAVVNLSPAPVSGTIGAGGLIVLVAPAATPLGLVRRLLERCLARARMWLDASSAAP